MSERKVLLFDLGGVLIENAMFEELPSLLADPLSLAALQDRWLASEAVRRFERGAIEADEFGRLFVAEWDLALEPRAFLCRFAALPLCRFAALPLCRFAALPDGRVGRLRARSISWPACGSGTSWPA